MKLFLASRPPPPRTPADQDSRWVPLAGERLARNESLAVRLGIMLLGIMFLGIMSLAEDGKAAKRRR